MVVNTEEIKRHIKPKADSTLRNMRKDDLIEYVRCLEHNYNVGATFLENQARYIESLVVPGRGCWMTDEADAGEPGGYEAFIEVHCSECRYSIGIEDGEYGWYYGDPFPFNFCPCCGADMRAQEQSL